MENIEQVRTPRRNVVTALSYVISRDLFLAGGGGCCCGHTFYYTRMMNLRFHVHLNSTTAPCSPSFLAWEILSKNFS